MGRRASAETGRSVLVRLAPYFALVALSIAFRWPALINASTVNADAAVVGLQAMHILKGEFSWFLFGSGYQTSVDSIVAAGFFALLGATPLALMMSTLAGHIASTLLAYSTLARHLPRWTAVIVVLPLVFTTSPLHTYILGPPRQAALTLVFLAVWLIDRAPGPLPSPPPKSGEGTQWALVNAWGGGRFLGGVIASLACFADPYALLFLPAILLLALLTALERGTHAPKRSAATFAGALVGLVPFLMLLSSSRSVHGEATFTPSVWRHNASLLWDRCLPWVLGMTAYVPSGDAGYLPCRMGPFRVVELAGPILVFAVIVFGVTRRRPSPEARSLLPLGIFGAAVALVSLTAFLVSPMVMDLFSARYLAALVLTLPFALAPGAALLRRRTLGALVTPFVASAAVCGWVGFGEEVSGILPVRLAGGGAESEARLGALLRERGVAHAVADYWVSYRLTFLSKEAVEVVPIHASEDRYTPYRRAFEEARTVAYIFDPHRSRESLPTMLDEIATKEPYGVSKETLQVGELTAVILER
jgi:hypothetical protein